VILAYAAGAAAIAFWLVVRYPSLGPQKLRSALAAAAAAVLLEQPLFVALHAVRSASGRAAAVLIVGLPLLTMLFWSSGCLVRAAIRAQRR
jgi:hypothetical protein